MEAQTQTQITFTKREQQVILNMLKVAYKAGNTRMWIDFDEWLFHNKSSLELNKL